MLSLSVTALLALVQGLLPALTANSPTWVSMIISTLNTIIPDIIANEPALVQSVQNLIADLKGNRVVTTDEVVQLEAFEAQLDAAFEAAAKVDGASPDPAA